MTTPTLTLNDGNSIPQLGLGVFLVEEDQTEEIVGAALAAGYRHIDTAKVYGNEEGVGRAIAKSGIPREDLFITTKLANDDQGYDSALKAIDGSLERLGLDYVDLYLIHWPVPSKGKYVETWKAMEQIKASGKAKSVGVSNFQTHHLQDLFDNTELVPAVNQVELHPKFAQGELRAFCDQHGIAIESWGPLGQGKYPLLEEPAVVAAAETHGKSPAQVVIRWHLQHGLIVFPKTSSPERAQQNLDVFDFELTEAELAAVDALDEGLRVGGHPDET
ncbi:aldo/keto reductase [Bogoriella caseilytica]|uniref:Diketogulonate reductase-like aldo/keto reductase n=1 Tax=Bogoriella caseilytica TaxID=56055 RepID=A0A3N2BBW2_9MICO|nr:aldo/keto reductase [Bogoriella caseilytica]ROR72749.1 diketogulonate reductase-like aldo/keto reductase [Bogoriella caseilytica]